MVYLLRSFSTSEGVSFGDYAIVELDADDLRRLVTRRAALLAAKAADDGLYEMWYWAHDACFYSGDVEIPDQDDGQEYLDGLLKGDEARVLGADEAASVSAIEPDRTDCDQLIVRENGVCWYAA